MLSSRPVQLGSDELILIETALVTIAIAVALFNPLIANRWFRIFERQAGRLARRQGWCVLIVGLAAFYISVLSPLRVPEIHDEFSYLLAADTFASGRLTNQAHPMWRHFESMHIIQQPTYSSMYPPAQGLMLALGVISGGGAWFGVCLSVGLGCAAICWMLQGWVPPGWSLLGAILALMRLSVFHYWANTYWGGMVAVIGGALVLGAVPRLMRELRVIDTLLLGLGIAILLNSRPYEGLVFCIPVGLALLIWAIGTDRPSRRLLLSHGFVPLMVVLLATGASMAWYFHAVTGNWLRMPYEVNQATYTLTNPFFWQEPLRRPPVYRHAVMRDYYKRWELASVTRLTSLGIRLKVVAVKFRDLWPFFLGPALSLPLLMLPWAYKDRKIRLPLIVCLTVLVALAATNWITFPHYAAPITAATFAVVLQSARHLKTLTWRSRPSGIFLVRAVPVICFLMLLVRGFAPAFGKIREVASPSWCCVAPGNHERASVETQLESIGGKHLVIVRYYPLHRPEGQSEWVYNRADIDSAKVVWAREMGRDDNQKLITYFKERRVWLLEPDLVLPRLSRYPIPKHSSAASVVSSK